LTAQPEQAYTNEVAEILEHSRSQGERLGMGGGAAVDAITSLINPVPYNSGHFKDRLRAEWAEFLGRWSWEWFGTFTFRGEIVHPERADKQFRRWLSDLNSEVHGKRWKRGIKSVGWARALEIQKRGVIHYHALIRGVGDLRRLSMMDRWNEMAGFSKILPIRSQLAVRNYVSKYVVKDGEIDFGGLVASGEELDLG
jgi:hypothetical protein